MSFCFLAFNFIHTLDPLPNNTIASIAYAYFHFKFTEYKFFDFNELIFYEKSDIFIPKDLDFVIEGYCDPEEMEIEGMFGDHTGYYTLKEPYPVLNVTAITHKKNPIFYLRIFQKLLR